MIQRMFFSSRRSLVLLVCGLAFLNPSQAEDSFKPHQLGNLDNGAIDGDHANESLDSNRSKPSLLREGTSLPPTSGRIVLVGRRWIFIPRDPKNKDVPANPKEENTTEVLLHRRMMGDVKIVAAGTKLNASSPDSEDSSGALLTSNGPKWQLVENLMLQRIVNAIRTDSVDDAWIVTGRITEFFDENYLIIESARRSNR
jgi:hypothetical protein